MTNWPQPQNVKSVRTFLGFSSYYRRFVANFAQIAKPLIGGEPKKRSKTKANTKPPDFVWGTAKQEAFDALKTALTSPPLLAYAKYDTPFIFVH